MIHIASNDVPDLYIHHLAEELLRVTTQGSTFITEAGCLIEGAEAADVIRHLTATRGFVPGRQHRFSGVGDGETFPNAIRTAGFEIVHGYNDRDELCTVITL